MITHTAQRHWLHFAITWSIVDEFIKSLFKVVLNPNQTGLFGRSKDRGGWISPKGLMRSYAPIFHPNSPEMVSNDIWYLHSSMESLKTTLWFRIFPQYGSKVTLSQGANFSLSVHKFLKICNFWPIWTIYTSNES